jgi:hypothetical protein
MQLEMPVWRCQIFAAMVSQLLNFRHQLSKGKTKNQGGSYIETEFIVPCSLPELAMADIMKQPILEALINIISAGPGTGNQVDPISELKRNAHAALTSLALDRKFKKASFKNQFFSCSFSSFFPL